MFYVYSHDEGDSVGGCRRIGGGVLCPRKTENVGSVGFVKVGTAITL